MQPRHPWAQIPLLARWGISLLVAVLLVVGLVVYVNHNNSNGEVAPSHAALAREAEQDTVLVGQDQAPQTVHVRSAAAALAALEAGVRADMRHRVNDGSIAGPVQWVRCGRSGAQGGRIAYHCLARTDNLNYPFVAVATPRRHEVTFCKKDYPPVRSENIPVSARCRL